MKENEGMAVKNTESGDWNTSFLLALSAVRKKAAIFTDKSASLVFGMKRRYHIVLRFYTSFNLIFNPQNINF